GRRRGAARGTDRAARDYRLLGRARASPQRLGRHRELRDARRGRRAGGSGRPRGAEGDELSGNGYEIAEVDDLEVMPVNNGEFVWRPVRRRFGISAFGSNGYSAEKAGQRVIEEHYERDG